MKKNICFFIPVLLLLSACLTFAQDVAPSLGNFDDLINSKKEISEMDLRLIKSEIGLWYLMGPGKDDLFEFNNLAYSKEHDEIHLMIVIHNTGTYITDFFMESKIKFISNKVTEIISKYIPHINTHKDLLLIKFWKQEEKRTYIYGSYRNGVFTQKGEKKKTIVKQNTLVQGSQLIIDAVKKKDILTVNNLINEGADVNTQDPFGGTPLHYASLHGQKALAELLINKGADVNIKDDLNRTPLHWASMKGYELIVKLLVDKGADANAKDEYGMTPIKHATSADKKDILKLLTQYQKKDFEENIETHYAELVKLFDQQQFDDALEKVNLFRKYGKTDFKDIDKYYNTIHKTIKIKSLQERIKRLLASDINGNLKIYKQLLVLIPNEQAYKKKVDHYQIKSLQERIKRLPTSDIDGNLKIYKQLLALNPNEQAYKKKIDHYQAKWNQEKEYRASCQLELQNTQWTVDYGYATYEGQVKNISNSKLENIKAVVTWYDKNDNMITFSSAMIEYNPILPGQASPFKVMKTHNPAMEKAKVEFSHFSGSKIRTYRKK